MSHPAFPGGLRGDEPDLTERQRQVFLALVALHGRSAGAVGSEVLAQEAGLPWSPAGIRGVLAELEAMGLLERAHAAAGRVPTSAGYDFLIRSEVTPATLPAPLMHQIEERLRSSRRDVEELLHEAARVLSELTSQLGLAIAWSLEHETLTSLELAALRPQQCLLVLGFGGGAVRTVALELESPLNRAELDEVAAVLRERLIGRALLEVRERLIADPELARDTATRIVAQAVRASWTGPIATTLFSAGVGHIAGQPEFADGRRLGSLLRVVESGPPLDRLMTTGVEGFPAVRVGLDEDRALQRMSLVSYPLPGAACAGVGVLGPLRMDYSHALGVVDAVGSVVAELL
jgi:heat-inducible transcriptional repressor